MQHTITPSWTDEELDAWTDDQLFNNLMPTIFVPRNLPAFAAQVDADNRAITAAIYRRGWSRTC